MKKKKRGFTLVELLAVIVVLAIILVIAVPKILDVIKSSRENSLISSVKLVARNAEQKKLASEVLGESTTLDCSEVADLSSNDYASCEITFDEEGNATVTIVGKGKFNGYTCSGTKNNVTCGENGEEEPLACTRGYEYEVKKNLDDDKKEECVEDFVNALLNIEYSDVVANEIADAMCKNEISYELEYEGIDESNKNEFLEFLINEAELDYDSIKEYVDVGCVPAYLSQEWTVKGGIKEEYYDYDYSIKSIIFHKSTNGFDDSGIDVSRAQDGSIKLYFNEETGSVDIVSNETIYFPKDSSDLFSDLKNVKTIDFNDSIDTSKATDMTYMFGGCRSLVSLDVSSFDTSKVTSMYNMFCGVDDSVVENSNFVDIDNEEIYYCPTLNPL